MSEFFQDSPRLGNQYDDDALLRAYLRWRLPAKMHAEIEPDLRRLGHRVVTDILALAEAAEAHPPRHVPYDAWGRRIDQIETSDAWRELYRNIRVDRLKDKLGTRALPTAELTLEGTPAQLVGGLGDGVRKIATLFNVTRVYNRRFCLRGQSLRQLTYYRPTRRSVSLVSATTHSGRVK